MNTAIYKSLPYDPQKDLVDIAILGITSYVIVTAKGGAYATLKALIDAARAKPGVIPFASAGVGSSTHLAAEYFAQVAGIKMLPHTLQSQSAIGCKQGNRKWLKDIGG